MPWGYCTVDVMALADLTKRDMVRVFRKWLEKGHRLHHRLDSATVDFLIVQGWWEPRFTCSCKFVGIDADVLLGPAKNIADEHYDGLWSILGLRKVRIICGNCAHLDGGASELDCQQEGAPLTRKISIKDSQTLLASSQHTEGSTRPPNSKYTHPRE